MKLIDLLVKELPKRGGWPIKVTSIGQDYDRELMFYGRGKPRTGIILDELAVDHRKCGDSDKGVTRAQYEASLAKNDGWIEWGGGECPVDGETIVEVKYRKTNHRAGDFTWSHHGIDCDIIAYRPHRDINSRASDDRLEQDLNECIGQGVYPAWNGEGLPPVGTICEAKVPRPITGWEWREVKVVEPGIPGAEKEALVYDLETTSPSWADEFRPLRTEAEKAREAAEKLAVADIIHELKMDENSHRDVIIAQKLYRAVCDGKIRGVNSGDK